MPDEKTRHFSIQDNGTSPTTTSAPQMQVNTRMNNADIPKDTSQRGSDIRRFGSATAAFISDYNDTYKQVHK